MFNNDSLANEVWKNKYASEGEIHYDQMHKRLAKEFARIEKEYVLIERKKTNLEDIENLSSLGQDNLLLNEEELPDDKLYDYLENKIYSYLEDFKYIVPQGSIMSSLGTKDFTSLSNCVAIKPPSDSYNGIMYVDTQLTSLYRRRCGVGTDISNIRPKMALVKNAAKFTEGFTPFIERYSNTTREVAINGRRGALMISCHINHPDILDFIKLKRNLKKATGANLSVKVTDEFMNAVEKNENYILRFPIDLEIPKNLFIPDNNDLVTNGLGHYWRKVKARDIWNEIIISAQQCAEPGVLFWDTILQSPDSVYDEYKPIGVNPCAEIPMSEDSCRLICINLLSFIENPYTKQACFNIDKFKEVIYFTMRLGDDLVDLESEAILRILSKIDSDPEPKYQKEIEKNTWKNLLEMGEKGRRIGLGLTAIGDAFAALGYDYDSESSFSFIKRISKIKFETELQATIDLSILRGPFEDWNRNSEYEYFPPASNNVKEPIWVTLKGKNEFYQNIINEFPEEFTRMNNYGRRNVSWSTMAPTGSVSILTRTSSGIEPLFQPYYIRRKKINPGEVEKADYIDESGDSWKEFFIIHPQIIEYLRINFGEEYIENIQYIKKEELDSIFENSPWFNSIANKIDWKKRIKIQSIMQKYITHSISSTINLPRNTNIETVSNIYLEAWKSKLKGITIYIDGSRDGVMVSEKKIEDFKQYSAFRRPKKIEAEAFIVKIDNETTYNIFVGLCNKKPYEIFIKKDSIIKGIGYIIKIKKKNYIYQQEDINVELTEDIPDEYKAITRLVSIALRHGTEIKYIVEQLLKCDGGIFSFTKSLARILKKYIAFGETSSQKCEKCNSLNVVFEEGCFICKNCGYSKCG